MEDIDHSDDAKSLLYELSNSLIERGVDKSQVFFSSKEIEITSKFLSSIHDEYKKGHASVSGPIQQKTSEIEQY